MGNNVTMHIISLGAGVQSTALFMRACHGELQADCAIFADTGWEPRAVYEHLDALRQHGDKAGITIHVVTAGKSIRDTTTNNTSGRMPYYLKTGDRDGMLRRQCTTVFKIQPIRRKVRELLAERDDKTCVMHLGISTDEIQRMRTSDVKYIVNSYPLIDAGLSRRDCVAYLDEIGITAPRSACIGCPFHSDAEWRQLRDTAPDEFADAVQYEQEIQGTVQTIGMPYLHRQRVPLDQVDLTTLEDRGQMTFDDECAGVCGV